jgi:hypothetical protein
VRHEMLDAYLADNLKSRLLQKDGTYIRAWQAQGKRKPPTGFGGFNSQEFLVGLAEGKQLMESMPAPAAPKHRRVALRRER